MQIIGPDSGKDITAAANDWSASRRSIFAGSLQALLQHFPNPARPAAQGQANDSRPI